MRKSIFVVVLSLVAVLAVACGGNNAPKGANGASGNTAGGGGGGDAASADPYALYRKEGRSWMHKSTSKTGDMEEQVSYMKYEVIKVEADKATYKLTMLDKDKKENEHMPPSELTMEFKTADTTTTGDAPKVETTEETIKVAAGEFACTVTEMDVSGTKSKTWTSKEFPGLMVKSESTTDAAGMKTESKMELVEWKD